MRATNFVPTLIAGLLLLLPNNDTKAQQDTYNYCAEYFDTYGTTHPIEGIYSYSVLTRNSFGWLGIQNGVPDSEKLAQADGYICVIMKDDERTFDMTIATEGVRIRGTLQPTASRGLYVANCRYASGVPVTFNVVVSDGKIEYSYDKPRDEIANNVDDLTGITYSERQSLKDHWTISFNVTAVKMYPLTNPSESLKERTANEWKGNGSGIVMSPYGHVVTNFHVVEDAEEIEIEVIQDGETVVYDASVLQIDRVNDLAILKVVDINFDSFDTPPFSVKFTPSAVGTKVYAYGYPMALSAMGKEVKVTDGIISAKTGFNGDITTYQISAPIQGGNSGGPLFDEQANLIGINSSGLNKEIADNVGYSLKSSYVRNVFEVLPKVVDLPNDKSLQSKTLVDQIAAISPFVVMVKTK